MAIFSNGTPYIIELIDFCQGVLTGAALNCVVTELQRFFMELIINLQGLESQGRERLCELLGDKTKVISKQRILFRLEN